MRITSFLLIFSAFCAFAGTAKSQSAKVTLQKKNVALLEVLNEIEHQTNYLFVYLNSVDVKRTVSVQMNQVTVDKVLKELFSGENVSYALEGSHIVLTKGKKETADSQSVQQSKGPTKLTGIIIDESGEPLIGVSVAVRGTSNGTITDIDGNFTLNVKPGEMLNISYVGYTSVTLKAGTSPVKVILKEDSQKLDEVIVVGYGTTTKRSMIAAVSTVKAEQMANLPITNITQGLAGRAPGLIVQASGGGVNAKSKVSIRGGDNPLVVIDGVIRDYGDFTTLAPENIASMSILKDASATAVYGSRASNGILQITTKKGAVGKPRIEYSFNQSWSQPTVMPKKLDSYNMAYYKKITAENDNLTSPYSDEDLRKYKDGSDPEFHPNTDWEALTLRNFAPQQKHNLNISGGTETHNFYMSLGMIDQNSLYKNNNHYMKRTNFQLSDNVFIQEIGLKATVQLDGYLQKTTHPSSGSASDYAGVFGHLQRSPLDIGVNKYGLPYNLGDSPIAETAKDTGYKNEKENVVNGLLNLEWSIPWVKGLKARATGNYRFFQKDNKNWRKNAAQYSWDSTEPIYRNQPQLTQSMETGTSWTLQYFAEYGRTFGKHTLNVLGGYECSYASSHSVGLSRDSYEFPIDQINPGPTATMKNWGGEGESGRAAWIGQLKYNYDNRYFIEGSLRYDGSDNFPKNNRWGTFYSGSLGWSLGDEAFMETVREKNIFNMLKVRLSYGEVGLDNWGNDDDPFHLGRFAYLPSYGLDGMAYAVGGKYVAGFSEGALPSPDLSWFTTKQFDLGIDFSSLNDRLYGMFDYFYYQTKGFLYAPDQLTVGYTDPLGMSLPKVSTEGEHRRAGFEFQLGWRDDIGKDFRYDVAVNLTKFDQLWASDPREALDSKKNPYKRTTQQVGYAGIFYRNLGYYTSANDVYNSVKPLNSTNLTAGDLKYEDFNGDGVIDGADQYRMGKSSFPRANYGINLNLSYKGITLGVLFQGATRYDMYLGTGLMMASSQSGTTPFYDFQTDFWTPDNTDARFPRIISNASINGQNNSGGSDFWLINGAYFRLKDISISYDFKKLLLKKQSWINKLNVGLSGQNVFTISEATKYGLDPENANANRYDYPVQRVFAINVNVGF